MKVRQGHAYEHKAAKVLALQSADRGMVQVAKVDESQPYPLGRAHYVPIADLTRLPMRYYHGQVPA